MMQQNSDSIDGDQKEGSEVEVTETRQYFINNEKFQLLKQCQQDIYEATEVSPTIRKIVNELINGDNLQKVKSKFIDMLSN